MSSSDSALGADRAVSQQELTRTYVPHQISIRCPHCLDIISCDNVSAQSTVTCAACGKTFAVVQVPTNLVPNRLIGHFELVEQLGSGGFATVWKAKDTVLDRYVALKIPHRRALGDDCTDQFLREARAAAQLRHPNIVRVHATGCEGGIPYIVTDLVEGPNLAEHLARSRLTFKESAELCRKVGLALHEAHVLGVIHRDLKPHNIILGRNLEPYITDFGLARREAGEITLTCDGDVLGTPAYMPPEQARGQSHIADCRSDVYSLGVILFYLLTGELPFRGNPSAIVHQVLNSAPPSPKSLNPAIPRDLEIVCLKCLEKEPRHRYATAQDLADDLQRFLHGKPIVARPITSVGRLYRWSRRQPLVAALSAGLLIALVVGSAGAVRYAIRAAEDRANLYHRMVRQVQVGRMQMKEGYVVRAWNDLAVARSINTSQLDIDMLRQEAVACLGDFRGYEPITISSDDSSITTCALQPNGKLLAIGHKDGHIELADPRSGAQHRIIEGHGAAVEALAFSADGARLLIVDAGRRVLRCAVGQARSSGAPLRSSEQFQVDRPYLAYDLGFDGRYLVAHDAKSIAIWKIETQQHLPNIPVPENRKLVSVCLSPNAEWLAASYNESDSGADRLMLWSFPSGELQKDVALKQGQGFPKSLGFSHDSGLLAYGGEGLVLLEVPSLERYLYAPGDAVKAVAFSPDNRVLAMAQIRGTVTLWNIAASQESATLTHPRAPDARLGGESVVFSPDGQFLVSSKVDSARVWNLRGTEERVVLPDHLGGVPAVAFSPDGRLLASGSKDQTVRLWNLDAGAAQWQPVKLSGSVQFLAFSPCGRWLATADWTAGDALAHSLYVWNVGDSPSKTPLPHRLGDGKDNSVHGVSFSPDGRYLAACGNGMTIWQIEPDAATEADLVRMEAAFRKGEISLFAQFSPDSRLLAWVDNWTKVRVWDVETSSEVTCDAQMHQGWHGLAWLGNNALAFVGPQGTLDVWHARDNYKLYSLGESGEFQSPHIAATADGAYLVGMNTPESVALWDVDARKKLFVFRAERSQVWSLGFNARGTRLAVGLADGGVAVWDLQEINRMLAELDLSWLDKKARD